MALVASGAALLLLPAVAGAKTYDVTSTKDTTPNGCTKRSCTLREAVIASNASVGVKDTVVLPAHGPYKLQIDPTGLDDETTGDLDITDPVAIKHTGKGNATIDANKIDRVIYADIPPSSTEVYTKLKRITITGGKAVGDVGGGLELGQALLGLDHSKVIGNNAQYGGGGIAAAQGELTLTDSAITGNQTQGVGGGVSSFVETRIQGSTISRNAARGSGEGGGIYFGGADLTMTNDTVANNLTTGSGGGILSNAPADLNDVTVTGNEADSDTSGGDPGGGIYAGALVTVGNSIVAGNIDGGGGPDPDCSGTFQSSGHNIVNVTDGCTGFTSGSDFGAMHLKLGELAYNGGPTETVALKKGSAAIDKASKASSEKRDQRGRKRDKHPDIGAFEYGAKP